MGSERQETAKVEPSTRTPAGAAAAASAVSLTGVLRLRAADVPAEQPEGEHSSGLADDTLMLDEPSWSLSSD